MKFLDLFDFEDGKCTGVKAEYSGGSFADEIPDIIDLKKVKEQIEDFDQYSNNIRISVYQTIFIEKGVLTNYSIMLCNYDTHPEIMYYVVLKFMKDYPIINKFYNLFSELPDEYKLRLEIEK